jgi:flagellar biosynthetic protein FliO
MVRRILIAGVLLACAVPALGQATKPVALTADEYADVPLPPRRGMPATTQAATGAGLVRGTSDIVDTRRLAIAMAVVLGAIFISQKVWKRMGMPGVGGRTAGAMQVVSRLSISPKQQLLLVRVGQRVVLVGNSGTQMNTLCEIADPEEAAGLLGQHAAATVAEREELATPASSFNAVLGGEERRFEEASRPQAHADDAAAADQESAALATTREELNGLMEKVRGMSKQFGRV